MRRMFVSFLLIAYLPLCKKNEKFVTKIYEGCCFDQDMPVSISANEILILDDKERLKRDEADKYGYNLYHIFSNADTLAEKDTTIKAADYTRTLQAMKKSNFYIDSIGNIDFEYDEIPAALGAEYALNEKVDHFKKYKDYQIFSTDDEQTSTERGSKRNKLYIQKNKYKELLILKAQALPTPNFLLSDVTGDGIPELLIFYYFHLMNHDLTSIDIYKINFQDE